MPLFYQFAYKPRKICHRSSLSTKLNKFTPIALKTKQAIFFKLRQATFCFKEGKYVFFLYFFQNMFIQKQSCTKTEFPWQLRKSLSFLASIVKLELNDKLSQLQTLNKSITLSEVFLDLLVIFFIVSACIHQLQLKEIQFFRYFKSRNVFKMTFLTFWSEELSVLWKYMFSKAY